MSNGGRVMLLSPIFQQNLVALIIDEAHCVTKMVSMHVPLLPIDRGTTIILTSHFSEC